MILAFAVRRAMLAVLFMIGGGAALSAPAVATAQVTCEVAYPDFCIPTEEEVGDLNCADIGYSNFTVLDPDPHQLDVDLDGVGCEAVSATGTSDSAGISAEECDPSYPEVCIPPPPPDYDCDDVGYPITVIYDPDSGASDPHRLDPDHNGEGCSLYAEP